jgi:DNA-binding transcriptional LysR family regulator
MGIGQPAMSGALTRLREMFNDPILIKTGSGMEPTPRALSINKSINEALAMIEEAVSSVDDFNPAQANLTFKIMASEGLTQLFFPDLMRIIREQAPNVRFVVVPGDVRYMLDMLRDGEFDLVLGYVRNPPLNLYQLIVYPQRLVCVVSKENHRVGLKLTLDDFVALPHVVWGAGPVPFPTLEALIDDALSQRGLSRNVVLRVPNVALPPSIAAKTDMICVVPERVALQAQERNQLKIFPVPFPTENIDIGMYWHERRHRDPSHIWLRNTIRSVGEALCKKSQ